MVKDKSGKWSVPVYVGKLQKTSQAQTEINLFALFCFRFIKTESRKAQTRNNNERRFSHV